MNALADARSIDVEQEKDLIRTIVRDNCLTDVAVKKADTKIRYSKKVYRELFYRDNVCIGSRLVDLKTGAIVNEAGELSFDKDVYIYGVTCPTNTTALLHSAAGKLGFSLSFINDVFKQHTEDLPQGSAMLIKMENEDYAELIFGVTAESYGVRR